MAEDAPDPFAVPEGFRSGFVTLVGRPNVGKSTLLNRICGTKVSITSNKPQTTRATVRAVLNRPGAQAVFVDTPGIHRPRTVLGERLNARAHETLGDVDVTCVVVDATAAVGPGDRYVASSAGPGAIVAVNKCDLASPAEVMMQLQRAEHQLGLDAYFPISAHTGEGVDALVDEILGRLDEGPRYYPVDQVTDVEDAFWVAELVREQLLELTRDELPHSIATRVTEWEWPYVRCEIIVERKSQKGIVIGKNGALLKQVGSAARREFDGRMYLDLVVRVDKDWQRRPNALDRLGF